MTEVNIKSTDNTPEILLNPEGIIKIKGRAIDEKITKDYDQIMNWIDAYLLNPAKFTEVIIALEYLNSYNTIILTSILKKISLGILNGGKLIINWYYEEDDIDISDRGKYISSTINVPIQFILTDNIKYI